MQSTEAPVSGKAQRVARFPPWLFFTFIFKFTMGIGMPDIAAFAAGLDIEHFVLVDCLTKFAAFTLKDRFFLLLFHITQYGHVQFPSCITCEPFSLWFVVVIDKDEEEGVESLVPFVGLSIGVLAIPGEWLSLNTCPPGMGGHGATVSGKSYFYITVLIEKLSSSLDSLCMFSLCTEF